MLINIFYEEKTLKYNFIWIGIIKLQRLLCYQQSTVNKIFYNYFKLITKGLYLGRQLPKFVTMYNFSISLYLASSQSLRALKYNTKNIKL